MNYTTGWQCPICHHVFAPYIEECPYCAAQNVGAHTPQSIKPDELNCDICGLRLVLATTTTNTAGEKTLCYHCPECSKKYTDAQVVYVNEHNTTMNVTPDDLTNERRIEMAKEKKNFYGPLTQCEGEPIYQREFAEDHNPYIEPCYTEGP